MRFKVFGKTNNIHSKWVCVETYRKIQEICKDNKDVQVEFYDMDKPLGHDISMTENIYYVPTVICENNGHELDYVENEFAIGHGGGIKDMNKSQEWWRRLTQFVEDVIDAEKKRQEGVKKKEIK